MDTIRFDLTSPTCTFKPMNCVNNGPYLKRHAGDQKRSNFSAYRDLHIPFARNHDASFYSGYGGEFTVDISAIFRDFDADVDDPDSYDFACTDEYILITAEAGTETFYRLGQKIEHTIKKHNTLPPKDFSKWAAVCEHIIRHYNEGWADGFRLGIRYWEIWNEADLDPDDSEDKRTWGGTKEQYFDLYEITAKRLKARFPNLKIGGPALAFREDWAEDFLTYVEKNNVPLDFFSWHIYCTEPEELRSRNDRFKAMLVRHGFGETENILNEWNYIRGWEDDYVYSLRQILGLKGASFTLACMITGQKSTLDMMMYYDARPTTGFNGLFDAVSFEPLKGYYPFLWYAKLVGLSEVRAQNEPEHVYTLCGVDENGKTLTLITHYDENDDAAEKTVSLDFGKPGAKYEVSILDQTHDGEPCGETEDLTFTLPVHTCLLIREI